MQKLSDIKQLAVGKEFKPVEQLATVEEVDYLLREYSNIINQNFHSWYCKRFYQLGRPEVVKRASQACRDGNNPAKLFSFLLKK